MVKFRGKSNLVKSRERLWFCLKVNKHMYVVVCPYSPVGMIVDVLRPT